MVQTPGSSLPGLLREQGFGDRDRQLETLLQELKNGQQQERSGKGLKKACQDRNKRFI